MMGGSNIRRIDRTVGTRVLAAVLRVRVRRALRFGAWMEW